MIITWWLWFLRFRFARVFPFWLILVAIARLRTFLLRRTHTHALTHGLSNFSARHVEFWLGPSHLCLRSISNHGAMGYNEHCLRYTYLAAKMLQFGPGRFSSNHDTMAPWSIVPWSMVLSNILCASSAVIPEIIAAIKSEWCAWGTRAATTRATPWTSKSIVAGIWSHYHIIRTWKDWCMNHAHPIALISALCHRYNDFFISRETWNWIVESELRFAIFLHVRSMLIRRVLHGKCWKRTWNSKSTCIDSTNWLMGIFILFFGGLMGHAALLPQKRSWEVGPGAGIG